MDDFQWGDIRGRAMGHPDLGTRQPGEFGRPRLRCVRSRSRDREQEIIRGRTGICV